MTFPVELEALLNGGESDRVELKQAISDRSGIRRAICAFANDLPDHRLPGVVFLGVKDNGEVCGVDVDDEVLTTLSQFGKNGNITPFPHLTVNKYEYAQKQIIVLKVEPSSYPPVRYEGRVWVRTGPVTQLATYQEEKRLSEKRRFADLPFDIHPLTSAELSDLDIDRFRREYLPNAIDQEILAQNKRSVEDQLASLRFTTSEPPYTPTILGELIVGKSPGDFIPCDYVQFLRIDGDKLTEPIKDQKEIEGPLPDILRELEETIKINISIATDVKSSETEIRQPNYPLVALQQLTRNAIIHRTYEGTHAPIRITWFSDRIEIQNPGGPFGQVRKDNFGSPGITDYRNPNLAEAMKNMGYVQRFGVGIQIAEDELRKNGNPKLEFELEDNHVLATVRAKA